MNELNAVHIILVFIFYDLQMYFQCHNKSRFQYSLRRLFAVVSVIAVLLTIFSLVKWPLALLILAAINAFAAIFCFVIKQRRPINHLFATGCLLLMGLFFTDWGLSSLHPQIRIAWLPFIAASITQMLGLLEILNCKNDTRENS